MTMSFDKIVDQLARMPNLGDVPREELEWLVEHGRIEEYEPGVMMAPGEEIEHLYIVLSGRVVVRVDRGVGPRRVIEWPSGHITGLLPYSRMEKIRNDVVAEVRTAVLTVHREHFPELVHRCPTVTALTVHTMLDRARRFNASDLQDEKMISLGKLAAGLAHELNNPASATKRGANLLRAALSDAERASRDLCKAGLSDEVISSVEQMRSEWPEQSASASTFEREREIEQWLMDHELDPDHAAPLVDASATVEVLEALAKVVSAQQLDPVLRWIVASSTANLAAMDIEDAAARIYDLVAAVKRFTHMDRVAGSETVDVETGIRDTIEILKPRAQQVGATVTLQADASLPLVEAVGSDLNQVWMNLIENALDAVRDSGKVTITARKEFDRVVVRVIDDGPGIEPGLTSRIFDPFFTTKEPGQGLGLGLEIVRQLLRRHRGEISVTSKPGRTEFCVSLLEASSTTASSKAG